MMKVLIDTSPLTSGHAVRGVGMYTRFLSEALEKLPGLEIFRSGLEQNVGRVDIVHYPFFDLFFATLPLIKKAATIVTIHDVIPLLFPAAYPSGKRGTLALARQKLSLKSVAAIITDSETSKRDIVTHLGVPAEQVAVVYLAANPFLKPITGKTLRSAIRKLTLPKRYVLYVGDINYNKNLPQLIKAVRLLPDDVKLVFVGKNFAPQNIPEWQDIERQVALSDMTERVIFRSDVLSDDYDTLSAMYSAAALYVQPSLYEGFGLPVLEAMRCKTPVVATGNSSLLEIGGDVVKFTGSIAEELTEGMKEILALSSGRRKTLVAKALAWEQQFTWEKTAQKTVEVYKKIL